MTPKAPMKEAATTSKIERVLAANIKALMKAYPDLGSNLKLGKKTGLGASAVSRLINGHNATVETVASVAKAFGVEPWHLLIPGFDPKNLPTLKPVSESERALYERIKEVVKEFKES